MSDSGEVLSVKTPPYSHGRPDDETEIDGPDLEQFGFYYRGTLIVLSETDAPNPTDYWERGTLIVSPDHYRPNWRVESYTAGIPFFAFEKTGRSFSDAMRLARQVVDDRIERGREVPQPKNYVENRL